MPVDVLSVGVLVADHLCSPIDHLPRGGELVLADDLPLKIGGCAANAAMDLARVGVSVGIVGCVGDDAFGRFVTETLEREGVDVESIRRLPDIGTSGTLIVNVKGEDRRFIHMIGANGRISAKDVPLDRLRKSKILYVGGYLLMPGIDQAELAEVFRQARSMGVTTVLDVVLPDKQNHQKDFEIILRETDYFLPNNDEGEAITGEKDPVRQAEWFRDRGARTVVITCGGEGTVLISESERLKASSYRFPCVGATGAGDAFDAGYIAALLQGLDARGCLEWGSALGASCVRSIGATESVFTHEEAAAHIRANPLKIEAF